MPASLLELKKRIASVKQTSKITEAMHMVSAAKLNQTEKRDKGYQEYNQLLHQTVSRLMSASVINHLNKANYRLTQDNIDSIDYDDVFGMGIISDMIKPREEVHSVGYLVVTGDRGLVGSYNSSVIKQMMSLVADDKLQGRVQDPVSRQRWLPVLQEEQPERCLRKRRCFRRANLQGNPANRFNGDQDVLERRL